MKKIKNTIFLFLILAINTLSAQYRIEIKNSIKTIPQNASIFLLQQHNDVLELLSSECLGIPLKGNNNIIIIVDENLISKFNKVVFTNEKSEIFEFSAVEIKDKVISSSSMMKTISFYNSSNEIINSQLFDALF